MQQLKRWGALWAGIMSLLVGTSAWARGEDVTNTGPSFTKPDFIVHPGTDLTAYRMDCDVFGWNRDFTEVGAVGSEVYRGPKGKHRGDVSMLIYKVGSTIPIHNVNVHNITHADLPDNPIPLDDARDLMWSIEGVYLKMWPHRPKYSRPKKGMRVETLWAPVPGEADLCTPHVGFLLHYKNSQRFVNFVPLDMTTSCVLLKQTDKRTYWAKDDLAASMVRFDFSPSEHEKSARFVVSAAWRLGKTAHLNLVDGSGGEAPELAHTLDLMKKFGEVHRSSTAPEQKSNSRTYGVYAIAARPSFMGLAHYIARTLHLTQCRFETLPPSGGPDVTVQIGVVDRQIQATHSEALLQLNDPADPRSMEPRHTNSDFSAVDDAAQQTNRAASRPPEPSAMPANLPSAAPPPRQEAPAQYLNGWQVP